MVKGVAEVIAAAGAAKKQSDKIKVLRDNDSEALRLVFECVYNPTVEFLLPEGVPPYTPMLKEQDAQGRFFAETKKLYRFVKGGGDNIRQVKREMLFIQMLEGLDPDDAVMVCRMKDKQPFVGLDMATIKKAFEGIGANWVDPALSK